MKKITLFMICIIMALSCFGCSSSNLGDISLETGETGLYIKDGIVSYGMKESFDKDYYNKDDLEEAVNSEIEEYNSGELAGSEDAVTVSKLKIKSKEAYLVLEFASFSDYVNYVVNYEQVSEEEIFLGTLADANETFVVDCQFVSVSDGQTVSDSDILENEEYNILIINGQTKVQIDGGAEYMSDNCSIDDEIITTADGEMSYIIFQ